MKINTQTDDTPSDMVPDGAQAWTMNAPLVMRNRWPDKKERIIPDIGLLATDRRTSAPD